MKSKLLLRFALGLFGLAALILIYQRAKDFKTDIDIGSADTAGYVAAIQYLERGSRAVLLDASGKLVESPGYVEGKSDREIVWRPDGNRAFFSSDREEGVFNVFRWNPGNGKVERRSFGSRGKGAIAFPPKGAPQANDRALIVSGGLVLEFSPKDGSTQQVLPPIVTQDAGVAEDGGRGERTMAMYQRLGESFSAAAYGPDRAFIVATMRREDGEILIVQSMTPEKLRDGSLALPDPEVWLAGSRIDFDVSAQGAVVAATLGFRFPDPNAIPEEFVRDGVATPPYRQAVLLIRPLEQDSRPVLLMATDKDEQAMAWPRFSPDGKEIAVVMGAWEDPIQFRAMALARMPALEGGSAQATLLANGDVREPSWRPDGEALVFAMKEGEGRPLFTISRDGGRPERFGPEGDFGLPVFSPQTSRK